MAQPKQDSLIRRVEHARFEHAIFATYTIDIPFFEASVMRHLLRNGCRNSVVFADGDKLAVEMLRLSEPGHGRSSWWYGSHYSLVPVHHTSAFHPKIFFLVGETVEVYVGSGNLAPGGLANNVEIFHRVVCPNQDPVAEDAAVVRRVWRYIRDSLSARVPPIVRRQLDLAEMDVPWIKFDGKDEPGSRVVLGPGADVVDAMREAVGEDYVDKLYVMSPFFDARLAAFDRLIEALQPKKTFLLIQPQTVSLPGDKLTRRKRLEAYRIDGDAYVHAKVLVAECSRSSVLLAGSHNVSSPSFDGQNYEASLIRVAGVQMRFSEVLQLTRYIGDENRIPLESNGLRLRDHSARAEGVANQWLTSAQIEGNRVEVLARTKLDQNCRLVPIVRTGALSALAGVPQIAGEILRFAVPEGSSPSLWSAVAVRRGTERSQPVPLLHVGPLESQARSRGEVDAAERIKRLRSDLSELPELLNCVSALLMSATQVRVPDAKRRKEKQSSGKPARQLSYEDFVVPWQSNRENQQGSPARRSTLELVVSAISHAIEGKDLPLLDLGHAVALEERDSALASRSVYKEEALAGGRMESDQQSVRQLGVETRDDEVSGLNDDETVQKEKLPESVAQEEKLRGLRRAQIKLRHFAERFPMYLRAQAQAETLSFELFEKLAAAGSLITQFLGRNVRVGRQQVELLNWETWTAFNVDLFDVLSSSQTRFLSRFEWGGSQVDWHRSTVERFLGYVAIVERFCQIGPLETEQASRILVGVLRVCRALGVSKGLIRWKFVNESAKALLDAVQTSDVELRTTDWRGWSRTVARIEKLDAGLRAKYASAAAVADAQSRESNLWPGDWIWWPATEGHIGVIVAVDGSKIEIVCEPKRTVKVIGSYVVTLPGMARVGKLNHEKRRF